MSLAFSSISNGYHAPLGAIFQKNKTGLKVSSTPNACSILIDTVNIFKGKVLSKLNI